MVKRFLMHERLTARFCALLCAVLAVFLAAWVLSYFLLPEGFLKGRLAGGALAGEDLAGGSVWLEWLRLSAVNLGVMFLVIVAPNLFRSGDYPYGYVTIALLAAILGITIGTNSFAISAGGKIPPIDGDLREFGAVWDHRVWPGRRCDRFDFEIPAHGELAEAESGSAGPSQGNSRGPGTHSGPPAGRRDSPGGLRMGSVPDIARRCFLVSSIKKTAMEPTLMAVLCFQSRRAA